MILFIIILFSLCYNGYQIYEKNNEISNLEDLLKEKDNVYDEYEELYQELLSELGDFDNIGNEINLLRRESADNEELLELFVIDLDNLKSKNNELESRIIELERLANERKNTVLIGKNIVYSQFPKYPTGCESVALYILLKYYDVDVSVDDIVNKLKKGELPYKIGDNTYGGNPELEFIGDPRNNHSYGVYNKPLEDVANMYKDGVKSIVGLEFESMLEIVKDKRPVLVWTTINLSKPFISKSWIYKPTGEKINWISGEHAMVVIGYNSDKIIVSDPYTGTIRYFDKDLFKSRYDYLGKRVLYY